MKDKVFIDTNVLVYCFSNSQHTPNKYKYSYYDCQIISAALYELEQFGQAIYKYIQYLGGRQYLSIIQ